MHNCYIIKGFFNFLGGRLNRNLQNFRIGQLGFDSQARRLHEQRPSETLGLDGH